MDERTQDDTCMNNTHLNAPRLALPIATLLLASLASCALLFVRDWISGSWRQLYLPWNLFLAWLPLLFAWRATRADAGATSDRWRFRSYALAWLLFFPNAPYILTDLWHLPPNGQARFWIDLVLILLFALIGLVLGFISLYMMQRLVARRFGWMRGWLFAFGVAALSGCGLCIGRFLRWNSWDVILNPGEILVDLWTCALRLSNTPRLLAVPLLFAALTFLAYVILYALTRLPAPQEPELAPY
jgi:uncharacterized membrane protein